LAQAQLNSAFWAAGRHVGDYDNRELLPAEVIILARYREALAGRVLDAGCGAGRLLGYLRALGGEVHGVDISPEMVARARLRHPGIDVRVGDLADLPAVISGPFSAILLSANVLDVFDDDRRRALLGEIRGMLAPGGLLLFSSHNLAHRDLQEAQRAARPAATGSFSRLLALARHAARRSPAWTLRALLRLPRRRANRRRLAPLERRGADHAIINDEAHDYSLLHYYIARGDQQRQLGELGYELRDVLELDGSEPAPGADGHGPSLYYVASPC
jgi:SAM-dependent methyltransferase